ncbi:MAG TPA: asparagine synthase-related protein [Verrucomicrobiae bacterium]|nr:asparagine synthase-related protein [Verrucomicrobiae bacterium]
MADFILCFDSSLRNADLAGFLRQLYESPAPAGANHRCRWGAFGILRDACVPGENFAAAEEIKIGWVGDLPEPFRQKVLPDLLKAAQATDREGVFPNGIQRHFVESGCLDALNGAYAIALIGPNGACVITDPFSTVQLYVGSDSQGRVKAVGTHPDLVARAADEDYQINPASICDFLNTGTPCWPDTMHSNVRELAPGTVHCFSIGPDDAVSSSSFAYWQPPSELKEPISEEDLIQEFGNAWRQSVARRCTGDNIAVQLSGGMDSRLVLAAIPEEKTCAGLTLCDTINREAQIARDVARVYGREWRTLQRDPEYVGQTALAATRFTGCEGEWHHAHSIGFAKSIAEMGMDTVFTGLFMDNNFKGYYAKDLVREPRLGGLWPANYRIATKDYIHQLSPLCREHLEQQTVNASIARRKALFDSHFARHRQSPWEWLDGYPLTQASDNTGWIVERRVFPLRLPVMDRRLVDLAFRIPIHLKAGNRFFYRAAAAALGPGRKIQNANDGVRPGSSHASFLMQRCARKLETQGRRMLAMLGVRMPVPHSWHDYQRYWAESRVVQELIAAHGDRLQEFKNSPFCTDPAELLQRRNLPWRGALRLLQLAVWRSALANYQKPLIAANTESSASAMARS